MTRIFSDANVLFAAAISPDGRSAALIELGTLEGHDLMASRHVLGEARSNLVARYPEAVERFETVIVTKLQIVVEASPAVVGWAAELGLPENDAPVLAAAIACNAEVLVTGDRKHFGELFGRTFRGVKVMSLRDALGLVLGA